jgi:hypothetical protein
VQLVCRRTQALLEADTRRWPSLLPDDAAFVSYD